MSLANINQLCADGGLSDSFLTLGQQLGARPKQELSNCYLDLAEWIPFVTQIRRQHKGVISGVHKGLNYQKGEAVPAYKMVWKWRRTLN